MIHNKIDAEQLKWLELKSMKLKMENLEENLGKLLSIHPLKLYILNYMKKLYLISLNSRTIVKIDDKSFFFFMAENWYFKLVVIENKYFDLET